MSEKDQKIVEWQNVIVLLKQAQEKASKLEHNSWWKTYVDEMNCNSALDEIVEAAKAEIRELNE